MNWTVFFGVVIFYLPVVVLAWWIDNLRARVKTLELRNKAQREKIFRATGITLP